MDLRIQIVAILATLGLLLVVLELVRRRRLLERYALVWLGSALVLLALAVWKGLVGSVGRWGGVFSPPGGLGGRCGRDLLPAGGAVRDRVRLHTRPAAALLDGGLAPHRPVEGACAADR